MRSQPSTNKIMNIDVYKFGPENLAQLGSFIGHALSTMPPDEAQTLFAAIVANMAGNIPKEHWEAMKAVARMPCECGDPDCGKTVEVLVAAGDAARKQFKKCNSEPPNPDEQEIQE